MKKIYCLIFILVITFTASEVVFGGSTIDIGSPKSGDNWRLGSTKHIKWETEGISGDFKIILRRNNSKIGVIKNSHTSYVDHDALYMFNVQWDKAGYCKQGIVAEPGTGYKIRVRNKTTGDYADSPSFSIYEIKAQQVPEGLKKAKPVVKMKRVE
jgi:hypothetical protein